jgi:outer membrane protein, heavy metal efflux system
VIARELLDARRRVETFNRRTTELVRTRLAAGDVAELQLRVAQGELALAEQARIAAQTEYEVACRGLATAAGWREDEAIEPRGDLAKLAPLPSVESLLDGLDDHPRVAALDAAVEAAEARVASERRERWPEPSLGIYAAREREPGTPVTSRVVLATLEIPLPFFQRNQAGLARANAELRVARAAQATRRYELGQEIRRWRTAADGAGLRVRSYADEVLPRFAENLELLGQAFELGEIGGLEVVLARQRFADMQMEALAAWRDYIDAAEGLERAAGRPVAPAIDLGAP